MKKRNSDKMLPPVGLEAGLDLDDLRGINRA